jgi:hypothetical protein
VIAKPYEKATGGAIFVEECLPSGRQHLPKADREFLEWFDMVQDHRTDHEIKMAEARDICCWQTEWRNIEEAVC